MSTLAPTSLQPPTERRSLASLALLPLLGALVLAPATAPAAGLLTPADGSLPALQIRSHDVDVLLQDGYAVTTVEQRFHNPHDQDLEAIYSFPVPEHGSVAELTIWIDGQPVTGEVLEKEQARAVYEDQRAAGQDAGLTEQDAYRTFDVHVTPVRAGDDTRIRLVYLQPVKVDHGIGRYVYPLEEGGVDEQRLAFWTAQEAVQERFSFDLQLRSGYPVEAVRVPDIPTAAIVQTDPRHWDISLGSDVGTVAEEGAPMPLPTGSPAFTLDRDIVVYWRLAQDLPGSVDLVIHKPERDGRGTFLLTLTPGDDLTPIQHGADWVFVLDVSGSMQGKYATLADGVTRALGRMRPDDRFRIVTFNDGARELTRGFVPATTQAVQHWTQQVVTVQPGGGTNLYAGLDLALKGSDADRPTGLVLVTDGVANVGETRQRAFLQRLERQDLRLFTFIMGNSANRPLLEVLTQASNGFARSISNSDDIVGEVLTATSKLTHAAMHDVRVQIDGVRVTDLTPAEPGSLYRGQQLMLLGHYWGDGPAEVTLTARVSGAPIAYQTRFDFPAQADLNPELERLWAYDRIRAMQQEIDSFGDDADLRQGIVDLAVEYGLVTDHTSMLVVRDEVFDNLGIERRNAKRSEIERAARAQRETLTRSHRVDQAQPTFSGQQPRLSSGGAGALSPWTVALMTLAALIVLLGRLARPTVTPQ